MMKCTLFSALLPLCFSPLVLGTEYLVGVGKDETTGKKGIGFDPSEIHPAVGDTIVWEFRSGQHSVIQSTFANPCTSSGGINTGVFTVEDSLSVDAPGLPRFTTTVNSTDPLWFFDEAAGLCAQGGVLAVNPSSTQTAAAFKENAAKATGSTPAGSSTAETPESSGSSTQNSSKGTATQTSSSSTTTQTTPAPASTSNAAGKVGQASSLLLGPLSLLVFGML